MRERTFCFSKWCALLGLSAMACVAHAQSEPSARIVVDDAPFLSGRGAGMAGAISTLADSVDAPYYNPACIGGCYDRDTSTSVRELHFPHVGASANTNAYGMINELKKKGANDDASVSSAVLDAHKGARQYGRLSLFPNVVIGRMVLGPIVDEQVAAVPHGEASDLVDVRGRTVYGFGVGLSVADLSGRFFLGAFTSYQSRTETVGEFNFRELLVQDQRQSLIDEKTAKYSGASKNVGMLWRIGDRMNPTLAVVVRDLGDTHFVASQEDDDPLILEQDMTIGFSAGPTLRHGGRFTWAVEAARLSQEAIAMNKRFRTGIEWTYGGVGSFAPLSVRMGYNLAGISYGASTTLGLFMLNLASQAEDVGIGNAHLVERRYVATLSCNIVD